MYHYSKHFCQLGLFLALFFCVSCRDDLAELKVSPDLSVSVLPDSSFLGNCCALQMDGDHLYALDIDRRSVLRFDEGLTTFTSISQGGNGPGELIAPFSFLVRADSVFIMDFASSKMKVFYDGTMARQFSFPYQTSDSRFALAGSEFIFPFRDGDYCTIRMDSGQGEYVPFFEVEKYGSSEKTSTMNRVHVLSYGDKLVLLPLSLPWAKIVGMDGKELGNIDLCQGKIYSNNVKFSHQADGLDKECYTLNADGFISGDVLYILVPEYGSKFRQNRIVKFDLKTWKMSESSIILKGDAYSSICVGGSYLFCFNVVESQIERYVL